jgi:lipoprotein NlpI
VLAKLKKKCTRKKRANRRFGVRISMAAALLSFTVVCEVHAIVPQRILGDPKPVDETIASFTKIIQSGRLTGEALARRYWERGKHYTKLNRYSQAIEDFTNAIQLNNNMSKAFLDRGIAFARLEQYDRAFADMGQALQLRPNNGLIFANRGALNFLLGKYTAAAADFERFLKIHNDDLYRMLWLYLSLRYAGENAQQQVTPYASSQDLVRWPGAILELYLGMVELDDLIDALSKGVPNMQAGHRCEAYYYLAQYHLVNGDREKAVQLFDKAVATEANSYLEYEFAVAYSLKLKQK